MKPIVGTVWIVFDLDNGNPLSHRYCWCFETRTLAREHIAWQRQQRHSARLSPPIKYVSANVRARREPRSGDTVKPVVRIFLLVLVSRPVFQTISTADYADGHGWGALHSIFHSRNSRVS